MLLQRGGVNTYPVLLANTASVFQVSRPRQSQSALLKIAVREHVGQAERVVVFLCNKLVFRRRGNG